MSTNKDGWRFSCTISDFKEFKAVASCMLKNARGLYSPPTCLHVNASESIMFASDNIVYRRSPLSAKLSVSISRDAVRFMLSDKEPASVYLYECGTVIKIVKGEKEKEFETYAGHAPQIVLPSARFSATLASVNDLVRAITVLSTQDGVKTGIVKLMFVKGNCVVSLRLEGDARGARVILNCDTDFVGAIYLDTSLFVKLLKTLNGGLTIKAHSNTDAIVLNDCSAIAPISMGEEEDNLVKN